ncbi:MAG TPA: general stress protein [Nocardioidaceae bacterium]|nr:general stress protein [Nocardioidaceae bacterium]
MAFSMPVEPTGLAVGNYDSYKAAQQAVDYLADNDFPVEHITIVGKELRLVERVVGRLTTAKAARLGAMGGAAWGLFIGVMIMLFAAAEGGVLVLIPIVAAVFGGALGAITGALGHSATGGHRDFSSNTSVVPTCYEVLCQHQHAEEARNQLARLAMRG